MGYQSTKTGLMMMAPTLRAAMLQRRGLGDIVAPDTSQFSINIPQTTLTLPTLPPAYSDTTTFTGLPLVYEIGLGALALVLLFKFTGNAGRRVRAGVRAVRRA